MKNYQHASDLLEQMKYERELKYQQEIERQREIEEGLRAEEQYKESMQKVFVKLYLELRLTVLYLWLE